MTATIETATGIQIQLATIAPAVINTSSSVEGHSGGAETGQSLFSGKGGANGGRHGSEAGGMNEVEVRIFDNTEDKIETWLPSDVDIVGDQEQFFDCMFILFRMRKVIQEKDEDEALEYLEEKYPSFVKDLDEADIGEYFEIAEYTTSIDFEYEIHDTKTDYSPSELKDYAMIQKPLNELTLYDTLIKLSKSGNSKSLFKAFGSGLKGVGKVGTGAVTNIGKGIGSGLSAASSFGNTLAGKGKDPGASSNSMDDDDDDDMVDIDDPTTPVKKRKRKKKKILKELVDIDEYICQGCDQHIDLTDATEVEMSSRFWQGYYCPKNGREMIFHNKLCVKMRKIKEIVREKVLDLSETGEGFTLNINSENPSVMGEDTRPIESYTTYDDAFEESYKENFLQNVRPYREQSQRFALSAIADVVGTDRFEHVPEPLKYLDFREFGVPVFLWLLDRVSITKFDGFWPLIKYFGMQIPTPLMIDMLEDEDRKFAELLMRDRDDYDEFIEFCTMVVEAAIYPMATALWFASFVESNGEDYWREEQTEEAYKFFVSLAQNMIGEIESPQLMAISLEIPTNVNNMSAMEIALQCNMLTFLQDPRISAFATTLWNERKPIHPNKSFGEELSLIEQWQRLCSKPAKFYTTPSGFAIVKTSLYLMFVLLFNYITWSRRYNYEDPRDVESLLWFFAFGQLMFVFYMLCSNTTVYLKQAGTGFELIMACFWLILGAMRFQVVSLLEVSEVFCQDSMGKYEDICDDVPDAVRYTSGGSKVYTCYCEFKASEEDVNVEDYNGRDGPYTRQQPLVRIYMFIWAVQCILFWVKFVFFWRRLRNVGPVIKMIFLMVYDMIIFLGLITLLYCGITSALYYIIAEDLQNARSLGTVSSVGEYGIQTILGMNDWDTIQSYKDPNTGEYLFDSARSVLSQFWVFFTSIFGTIVMLNLLVAMLASRYSEVTETAQMEVNFLRVEESYNASQSGVLIPSPLIYLAFMLMGLWLLLDFLVGLASKGTKMVDDWYFTPLNKKVLRPGDWVTYKRVRLNSETRQYEEVEDEGYIHSLKCSEVGLIQEVGSPDGFIEVLESNILKIRKSFITEKNNQMGNIWKSVSRFYCKYCRFEFMTPDVGSALQIRELFKRYGKVIDPDDLGKLSTQLGESLENNHNPEKRTERVAQLCPQCYRPFFAEKDHSDELGRFMFLAECASFWVFLGTMWLPLVIILSPFALVSWVVELVSSLGDAATKAAKKAGGDSSNNDTDGDNAPQSKKSAMSKLDHPLNGKSDYEIHKLLMHEVNDRYRNNVRKVFSEELVMEQLISLLRKRVESLREKINDSMLEYEIENIPYRCQRRLQKNRSWKKPAIRKRRYKKLLEAQEDYRSALNTLRVKIRDLQSYYEEKLLANRDILADERLAGSPRAEKSAEKNDSSAMDHSEMMMVADAFADDEFEEMQAQKLRNKKLEEIQQNVEDELDAL